MISTWIVLVCSLILATLLHPSISSNSIKDSSSTSLKSLLKVKDISLKKVELELSDEDLKKYVPLAIEELESELLRSLEPVPTEHRRTKRTLLKKKLIIAKLLILKALFASQLGGQKGGGGYGYAPSVPSHYGPPPTPPPSYGPPPAPAYGPPPAPAYGQPPAPSYGQPPETGYGR